MSDSVSTLEIFPDELFLELFSFVKPIDLYRGFVNLNTRLNHILNDTHLCFHITDNNQDEDYVACLKYFATQIIYLAIDCHWSRLSSSISLRSLRNLRSLHLPIPSDEQCLEITPNNLPFLTNLTINDNTYKTILFSSKPYPQLATCCILRIYSSVLYGIEPIQSCLTLRALYLGSCVMQDVYDILPSLPNLKYLEIILSSNKQPIDQPDIKHTQISHLKVKLRQLEPDLAMLLKSMPNLHRLEFLWKEPSGMYYQKRNFNFERFADILEKNSTSLKRVDIDIHVGYCDYDINAIRQLNPQLFSSLSKIKIDNGYSFFITSKDISFNAEEKLISTLLQSTYLTQRNARFNRVKINKRFK